VTVTSGVTLPYVEQGTRDGVPVVFVHAIADSWRAFEPLLSYLPADIHAFALTQRGSAGASEPPNGYRPEDFAADLKSFFDAVDLEAAVVVGGSSGGVVARRFAIDHPDRTLGLVLLGSPDALADKPSLRELWDSTISTLTDPVDPDWVRGFTESIVVHAVPDELMETMVRENLKVSAHVWRSTFEGLIEDDSFAELGRIVAPTLVVWGDQDSILTKVSQEKLTSAIPGARLLVYAGAGHAFYWEDPARAAADVAAFATSDRFRI